MKKNRMLRLGSLLMVAVLLTTSVVSGTFAKYTAYGSGGDGARVAKWGVNVTTSTKGMFSHSYTNDDEINGESEGATVSVNSLGGTSDYLLAPGTSGSTTITLSGTPEVAVDVKFAMNVESDVVVPSKTQVSADKTLDEDYTPILFTLENSRGNQLAKGTLADIKTVFNGLSTQHGPNKSLNETYKLSWKWLIDGDNEADTYLGNVAAGLIEDEKTKTNVKFNYSVTVTQID